MQPVDVVGLGLHDYHEVYIAIPLPPYLVIKYPDAGQIGTALDFQNRWYLMA